MVNALLCRVSLVQVWYGVASVEQYDGWSGIRRRRRRRRRRRGRSGRVVVGGNRDGREGLDTVVGSELELQGRLPFRCMCCSVAAFGAARPMSGIRCHSGILANDVRTE